MRFLDIRNWFVGECGRIWDFGLEKLWNSEKQSLMGCSGRILDSQIKREMQIMVGWRMIVQRETKNLCRMSFM